MPKIDPRTGVSVMTDAEFIAKSASQQKIGEGELIERMFEQATSSEAARRQHLADHALPFLQQVFAEASTIWTQDKELEGQPFGGSKWDAQSQAWVQVTGHVDVGPRPPQPLEVQAVLETQAADRIRISRDQVKATCLCQDGQAYVLEACRTSDSGSTDDPPTSTTWVTWTGADGVTHDLEF